MEKQAFFICRMVQIQNQQVGANAGETNLDLLVVANPVSYTNERDFQIIAISDWQLHWCGGKALKSHLEIQIREWECCMKANVLSSCRSDCCISLVLNFYLFIIFYNCCSPCLLRCCCTTCLC